MMNTPTSDSAARYMLTLNADSDTKIPVTVVPMLAPMIMDVAWNSVMSPALTKPMTMTDVADEL